VNDDCSIECFNCGIKCDLEYSTLNICKNCGTILKKRAFANGVLFPQIDLQTEKNKLMAMGFRSIVSYLGLASNKLILSDTKRISDEIHEYVLTYLRNDIKTPKLCMGIHRNFLGKITISDPDCPWNAFGRRIGKIHILLVKNNQDSSQYLDLYESIKNAVGDILWAMQ
jgi:transcription initiation factor TFIIIB Brf1 subunit/transcription initiation factor TFIIB